MLILSTEKLSSSQFLLLFLVLFDCRLMCILFGYQPLIYFVFFGGVWEEVLFNCCVFLSCYFLSSPFLWKWLGR